MRSRRRSGKGHVQTWRQGLTNPRRGPYPVTPISAVTCFPRSASIARARITDGLRWLRYEGSACYGVRYLPDKIEGRRLRNGRVDRELDDRAIYKGRARNKEKEDEDWTKQRKTEVRRKREIVDAQVNRWTAVRGVTWRCLAGGFARPWRHVERRVSSTTVRRLLILIHSASSDSQCYRRLRGEPARAARTAAL